MERIQKVIAHSGYCSRRKAEEFIKNGKVKVNGQIVKDLGTKVNPSDDITVNNQKIGYQPKEYILLYKPKGVVTTTKDEKGRKTVLDLIKTNNRLYPIGRLDYDTSGLLLLTNDGELTNLLIHPKYKIQKKYIVKINKAVDPNEINKLKTGVIIDNKKIKADKVRIRVLDKRKGKSIIEVVIHEGKNHQVKKMFKKIGYNIDSLKRETFAFLNLDGLTAGSYRHLTIKEVKKLYNLKNKN